MSWRRATGLCGRALAWIPILLCVDSGAALSVSLDSQARTTTASAFYFADGIRSDTAFDGKAALGFGLFLEAALAATGLGDIAVGVGESVQQTDIQLRGGILTASGSSSAGATFDVNDPGFASSANGSGRTTFELRFVVEERSEYAIAVALEAELIELRLLFDGVSATGSALASFELRGDRRGTLLALELEDVLSDGLLLIDSLAESGFLEPDTYQITVVVSASWMAWRMRWAKGPPASAST